MSTSVIPVDHPGESKFAGVVLYWSRSPITDAKILVDGVVLSGPPGLVDVEGPVIAIGLPDGLKESSEVSLLLTHSGEQVSVLDIVKADSLAEAFAKARDAAKRTFTDWLECRLRHAKSLEPFETEIARAQLLMRKIDLETNTYLLDLEPSTHDRAKAIKAVTTTLRARLSRCWHEYPDQADSLRLKDDSFNKVNRILSDVVLSEHDAENAFDLFAAGLLRQPCTPPRAKRRLATCDADSAMLFMFAEFAFAAVHRGHAEWTPFLNPFVRMQAAYIARWRRVGLREHFWAYAAPPAAAVIERHELDRIRQAYACLGSDPCLLRRQMHINLRTLADDPADPPPY